MPPDHEKSNSSFSPQDILFLLVASACVCIPALGNGSLASWDEAYYAIVSREIFRSGDWVHLKYFNTDFYDKPPLYMWVSAFFYKLFGVNELSSRLGSALSGIGVILATYGIGLKLLSRTAAVAGAGLLLSSTDFLHYARWGTLDIMNLLFFSLTIFFYFQARERSWFWLGVWLASAAAIMTKGLLISLAWSLIFGDMLARRDLSALKHKHFWLGILVMIIAVFPWHWAVFKSNPQAFVHDILKKHYLSRTTQAVEGHIGNTYFYIRTLINKYHPWIIAAIPALPWALWSAVRSKQAYAFRFLLVWVLWVLAFFTFLVQTKLQWYILPLHPALSLVIGAFLAAFIFKDNIKWLKIMIVISLALHIPFTDVFVQDYVPALKSLAPRVRSISREHQTVHLYQYHEQPAATFYFDRPVAYVDSLDELDRILGQFGNVALLIRSSQYDSMRAAFAEKRLAAIEETSGFETNLVLFSNR